MGTQGTRWQYALANVGMFGAKDRLARALSFLGEHGYELVTVYDKASNWFNGMEKGFMLFKREVPAGQDPDGAWCNVLDPSSLRLVEYSVVVEPDAPTW